MQVGRGSPWAGAAAGGGQQAGDGGFGRRRGVIWAAADTTWSSARFEDVDWDGGWSLHVVVFLIRLRTREGRRVWPRRDRAARDLVDCRCFRLATYQRAYPR
jgi:hypothetical protein